MELEFLKGQVANGSQPAMLILGGNRVRMIEKAFRKPSDGLSGNRLD
jgi:hypothetical protein